MSNFSGSLENTFIPWQKVMPPKVHQTFIKKLVDDVKEIIDQAPSDYYQTVWRAGNSVFSSLGRCSVDRDIWGSLIAAGEGNVPAIRSFKPDAKGFVDQIVYDRCQTVTGRLTVKSGPQILTLKREHRRMLRSVHGDAGAIVALDFAALEARILLYEYGRRCDELDLYDVIAKELGYGRTAIKGAVISELYGSSKRALGERLGIEGNELQEFVRRVQTYFNTTDLLLRIKKQFITTGKVINRYGRRVTIEEPLDNLFISYYGQSTGVDVTMLGFKQIIDTLSVSAPSAKPVFLLHDACLFDVLKSELQQFEHVKRIKVKGYVQNFFLKLDQIS